MTVIEVASIRPPSEARKPGHVIDASGASFECWPEKLGKLQVGRRYAVEVETREWRGRPIRKITKAQPVEAVSQRSAKRIHESDLKPAQPVSAAEQAFVARVLGAVISGQLKFESAELTRATRMLQVLYSQSFGERVPPNREGANGEEVNSMSFLGYLTDAREKMEAILSFITAAEIRHACAMANVYAGDEANLPPIPAPENPTLGGPKRPRSH
jgi:hypothetical protein